MPSLPPGLANWLIVRANWNRLLAGRRYFPLWGVLRHRGRRTGRTLTVPVAVRARADAFVIPLLFGPRTNWVRNVLAAEGCVVHWRGVDHPVHDPELVGSARARPYFGRIAWLASETLVGPEGFLLLHRTEIRR